jgi:hypothetical protein
MKAKENTKTKIAVTTFFLAILRFSTALLAINKSDITLQSPKY